jgi:ATP-dependent RNA helicase DeaD
MTDYNTDMQRDAITQALGDPQIGVFRELVAAYEAEHDISATDVAAAIAVLAQDGEPLLLEDMPEPIERPPRDRAARERQGRDGAYRMYRIAVGRRQNVEPRQIVGAIANEGGLSRDDFGRIEIKSTFSLVELPTNLAPDTLRKLTGTRISGVLIDIQPDQKPHSSGKKPYRKGPPRTDGPPRKARHKPR